MQINKIDILVIILSSTLALVIGLILIRWLQPSLLGVSDDMILVQSSEEVVPFYENIFNKNDISSNQFILKDPYVKGRSSQFYPDQYFIGPHDVLGFRNESVPNHADIVIIGDSQTYGNNAHMRQNWPHYFAEKIPEGNLVYSMATGGWGGIQYYYAATKALAFKPEMMIVAFYTGNDALETFSLAYASRHWNTFITDPSLTKSDAPKVNFPAPESDHLLIKFSDNTYTKFTPELRNVSNQLIPAVNAGYQAMIKSANMISDLGQSNNIKIIFTIIPTKEYVYSKKISDERIQVNDAYKELVKNESSRIIELSNALRNIEGAEYIDISSFMQEAALDSIQMYPPDDNGHPIANGYKIIGDLVANQLKEKLTSKIKNGVVVANTSNNENLLIYVEQNEYWIIDIPSENLSIVPEKEPQILSMRDLSSLKYSGHKSLKDIPGIVVQ